MYNYTYNELGNIKAETRNGETFKTLEYDRHNRLTETTIHTSDETLVYTPIYETREEDGAIYADNAIKGMTLDGIFEQSVTKDKYGRPTRTSLRVNEDTIYDECGNECREFTEELLASEYSYLESNFRLTNIVDTVTHKVNGYISDKLKYKYDGNGNITVIYREGEQEVCTECGCDECGNPIYTTTTKPKDVPVVEYFYDGLNRLTRENNYVLGKTYTYKYDAAGNILSKSTYAVTSGAVITPTDVKLYKYASTGWKDKLVNYDGVGIAYDMMGNPWSYRGHNLEWSRIRLLTKWDDIEMEYNASGMRTRKGDTYYELDGSNIISETTNCNTIRYYYGNGGIVGFRYNGNRYYYEKNLQGDIIGIYDEDGSKLCEYIYDAWGNCTIENDVSDVRIGEVNSFRYRGYYYDSDIGLYYLKSRYYDAITGRFINADEIDYLGAGNDVGAYNFYSYCGNDPINLEDSLGHWPNWNKLVQGALLATIGVLTVAAVVATGGTCIPAVAAGYSVLATAGTVAAVMGTSEAVESFTGKNAVRDYMGSDAYDTVKNGAVAVMSMGSSIISYGTSVSVCFVAGTPVSTENGSVAIETVKVGDMVWAENPETGEEALKRVVRTFVNKAKVLVHVRVNGEEIVSTEEHPYYVKDIGWVGAVHLKLGDVLVLQNGNNATVESVELEELYHTVAVYNFEVEGFHTYFVGSLSILVHNTCGTRGVGGKGWVGDKAWKQNVSSIRNGGTITSLNGGIPTEEEAIRLIQEAGGNILRTEARHNPPNPHTFRHINYMIGNIKGTIQILE